MKIIKISSGKYLNREISEYGDILALKGKKTVTQSKRASGLLYFKIQQNGKTEEEEVRFTLARNFIPNINNYKYVINIDGDIENNHYSNLKWSEFPEEEHERFKIIPWFSNYKVSKKSEIQSYFNKIPFPMKPIKTEKGYMSIKLVADDGVAYNMFIHRIVALTYLPNPDNLPHVDHIDRNKENNCLENLQWVTVSQNYENKEHKKFFRRIEQFDLLGKSIAKFKNASEAIKNLNLNIFPELIIDCANKNKIDNVNENCLGFVWKYAKREKFIFQEGEIAENIVRDFGFVKYNLPNHYITNYGNAFDNKGFKMYANSADICPIFSFSYNCETTIVQAHVLVALFFVKGRTNEKSTPDHLDEDRTNARFDNLEWVTRSENSKRAAHKKHKAVNKIDIKTGEILKTYKSIIDAAKDINIANAENISTSISKCCNGIQMSAYKFKWGFVDKKS